MREIKPELTSRLKSHFGKDVSAAEAYSVATFRELVELTASLAYLNRDELLFYRGQDQDYRSKAGTTTLYPPIYRGDQLSKDDLEYRFKLLDKAALLLVERLQARKIKEIVDIRLKKYIQWSILQHYEVTYTPLLDVTHSLRVACSFAQLKNREDDCFVYVFGLPYLTNRISINSEHDLVNIRLLSICPPAALRPYYQEGYLVGTTDVTTAFASDKTEVDFRRRLIAKFRIPGGNGFWGGGFQRIPKESLYPSGDSFLEICEDLKNDVVLETNPGTIGEFLLEWSKTEQFLLDEARALSSKNISVREALRILYESNRLNEVSVKLLSNWIQFRNTIVHRPDKVFDHEIAKAIQDLKWLVSQNYLPKRN